MLDGSIAPSLGEPQITQIDADPSHVATTKLSITERRGVPLSLTPKPAAVPVAGADADSGRCRCRCPRNNNPPAEAGGFDRSERRLTVLD